MEKQANNNIKFPENKNKTTPPTFIKTTHFHVLGPSSLSEKLPDICLTSSVLNFGSELPRHCARSQNTANLKVPLANLRPKLFILSSGQLG